MSNINILPKKKVLVLTGSNETMYDVLDLTITSKRKYTQQHGYDLLVKRFFQDHPEYGYQANNIGIGFSRVLFAFQMLEHYDVVMWLDADSIVTNTNLPIEHFIEGPESFFASYDWLSHKNGGPGHTGFSTGNFIIKRTDNTPTLYSAFFQESQRFLEDHGADQTTLNYIHNNTSLRSEFAILDHSFLNAVPELITTTNDWSSDPKRSGPTKTHSIVHPWTQDCFLMHLTGCSNEDRIQLLKKHFAHYL